MSVFSLSCLKLAFFLLFFSSDPSVRKEDGKPVENLLLRFNLLSFPRWPIFCSASDSFLSSILPALVVSVRQ